MSTLRDKHREAMKFMQMAKLAEEAGGVDLANDYMNQALEQEKDAAYQLFAQLDKEPTRGILFRSAGSIALRLGLINEAEKMIAAGLAGNPPSEIAEELRDLLEQVESERHLNIRGVSLERNDFQLSLSGGSSVGYGFIESKEVLRRINALGSLFYRRMEQRGNKEFRASGGVPQALLERYPQFLSAPRAQSFAVSIRIGNQLELPGLGSTDKVISEMIDHFQLLNDGEEDKLRQNIGDSRYFQNFISLAREVAPDGERIKQIGLTSISSQGEKRVKFLRPRKEILPIRGLRKKRPESESDWESIELTGELTMAHGKKNVIELLPANLEGSVNKGQIIIVPEGLNDLVRMYFGFNVVVSARQYHDTIELTDISLAQES